MTKTLLDGSVQVENYKITYIPMNASLIGSWAQEGKKNSKFSQFFLNSLVDEAVEAGIGTALKKMGKKATAEAFIAGALISYGSQKADEYLNNQKIEVAQKVMAETDPVRMGMVKVEYEIINLSTGNMGACTIYDEWYDWLPYLE